MTVAANKPSNFYYEIIASSDEVCFQNSGCSGSTSLARSSFDGWSDNKPNTLPNERPSESQARDDPRDVRDLSKRFLGDIHLPEGK